MIQIELDRLACELTNIKFKELIEIYEWSIDYDISIESKTTSAKSTTWTILIEERGGDSLWRYCVELSKPLMELKASLIESKTK